MGKKIEQATCCGRTVEFRFCPVCGKLHKDQDPLVTLHAHCLKSLRALETSKETNLETIAGIEAREKEGKAYPQDGEELKWRREHTKGSDPMIAKWKGWVDALSEVIAVREKEND